MELIYSVEHKRWSHEVTYFGVMGQRCWNVIMFYLVSFLVFVIHNLFRKSYIAPVHYTGY